MLKTFIRIPGDGALSITTCSQNELPFLQQQVGGRIEVVTLPATHIAAPGHAIVLNEEGKLHQLPVNSTQPRSRQDVSTPWMSWPATRYWSAQPTTTAKHKAWRLR